MFYNQGLPDIISSLVMGPNALRHLAVPASFVGHPYKRLFAALLDEHIVPVGLYASRCVCVCVCVCVCIVCLFMLA